MGQKSDRQKVAMRPDGGLYKIILPAIPYDKSDSEEQLLPRHHTNPISPLRNVTPDFQKEKKEINFQNSLFLAQIVASQWGYNLC